MGYTKNSQQRQLAATCRAIDWNRGWISPRLSVSQLVGPRNSVVTRLIHTPWARTSEYESGQEEHLDLGWVKPMGD